MPTTLTPGLAVAPRVGYAALGVILEVHARHPRANQLMPVWEQAGMEAQLDEVWYLVRWEEGVRALVHYAEVRPYPVS